MYIIFNSSSLAACRGTHFSGDKNRIFHGAWHCDALLNNIVGGSMRRSRNGHEEHTEIVEAIAARDVLRAKQAFKLHVLNGKARAIAAIPAGQAEVS